MVLISRGIFEYKNVSRRDEKSTLQSKAQISSSQRAESLLKHFLCAVGL
jgi:hypothetical protein